MNSRSDRVSYCATKHKTQNTKHKTQNTKHKTQNTKHKRADLFLIKVLKGTSKRKEKGANTRSTTRTAQHEQQ